LFSLQSKEKICLLINGEELSLGTALGFKDETHAQEAVRLKVNLFLSSLKRDEQK
jgi:hypothetical protein